MIYYNFTMKTINFEGNSMNLSNQAIRFRYKRQNNKVQCRNQISLDATRQFNICDLHSKISRRTSNVFYLKLISKPQRQATLDQRIDLPYIRETLTTKKINAPQQIISDAKSRSNSLENYPERSGEDSKKKLKTRLPIPSISFDEGDERRVKQTNKVNINFTSLKQGAVFFNSTKTFDSELVGVQKTVYNHPQRNNKKSLSREPNLINQSKTTEKKVEKLPMKMATVKNSQELAFTPWAVRSDQEYL